MNIIFLIGMLLSQLCMAAIVKNERLQPRMENDEKDGQLASLKRVIENMTPENFKNWSENVKGEGNDDDGIFLFPSQLLTQEMLTQLKLEYLKKDSSDFRLGLTHKPIFVPKVCENIFIFNTTNMPERPFNAATSVIQFVTEIAPFNLPQYLNLDNYFAIFPESYFKKEAKKILENDYIARNSLHLSASKFPLLRRASKEKKPLMLFIFNSRSIDTFGSYQNPIMNTKHYLTSQKEFFSAFFDLFAYNWIEHRGFENLIKSIFCTIDAKNMNDSYCLKLLDNNEIHLFPVFAEKASILSFADSQKFEKWSHPSQNRLVPKEVKKLPFIDNKPDKENEASNTSINHSSKNFTKPLFQFEITFPASSITFLNFPVDTPRKKNYSQIIFPKSQLKRNLIFSNDSNCDKITWYNIFHHSIFGKPRFCID